MRIVLKCYKKCIFSLDRSYYLIPIIRYFINYWFFVIKYPVKYCTGLNISKKFHFFWYLIHILKFAYIYWYLILKYMFKKIYFLHYCFFIFFLYFKETCFNMSWGLEEGTLNINTQHSVQNMFILRRKNVLSK